MRARKEKHDSRLNKKKGERHEYGINHRFYAVIKQRKRVSSRLRHDFASPRLEIGRRRPPK